MSDVAFYSFETKLVIQLTIYTSKGSNKGKGKKKTKSKAKKTKETTFTHSSDNHLDFLRCLLTKHGQNTSYKVTEQKRFSFNERDAIDVENANDYCEMVANLTNSEPDKIKILMDMKVIRSSCGQVQNTSDDEGNSSANDNESEDEQQASRVTDLEKQLAHLCMLLKKKWGNDHDNSCTYIYPDGTALPLMLHMIKEWAHAIYDGADVTIKQPPNTQSFDPANELGHVASIFFDLRGLILNCTPVTPIRKPSTPTVHRSPSTPTVTPTVTSPTPYTPLLLSRFLQYMQDHLGVRNAISYENALLQHGFGPDILHKVPSKDLEDLGISAGDII
ncbi:hypothetical protein F5888DRAFT_1800103 [Russula emetica]|nr:hypothetical protein F5888DRAFT_1800103 [Russula emetica]